MAPSPVLNLTDLVTKLVGLGYSIRHPQSGGATAHAPIEQLKQQLDWRAGLLADWTRRCLPLAPTEAARDPFERLLRILHRYFGGSEFRKGQFLADLGQVVWDLERVRHGLEPTKTPQYEHRLKKVWPQRPANPGLDRIEVNNFRCLRAVFAPLKPLTVLIGANDSGKSAFLAAVEHVIEGGGIQRTDHWRENEGEQIVIRGHSAFGSGEVLVGRERSLQQIGDLRPVKTFHLPSDGVRMVSAGQPDSKGVPELGHEGDGVPGLFDYLLRQDRDRFYAATEAVRSLVPGVSDINIGTPKAEQRQLDLVLEGGFRLPADKASTGVRLLLTFVALAYHPTPPRVILLEEPETGVHPKRLQDILRLLREITSGDHGEYPAQVILTTHSPYLLNSVDLATDQVLVFRRNADGSRTGQAADAERLAVFLDEFGLGEVWFNRGEDGMVAGKS